MTTEHTDHEITHLLDDLRKGDEAAESKLLPLVYNELSRLARFHMKNERGDHTLQPTALINEAYMRLTRFAGYEWSSRAHFFASAAQIMRRVLVDHARARRTQKRWGEEQKITLDGLQVSAPQKSWELLALDDALARLEKLDARQARIVELRFFAGMSEEEIADVLTLSSRTVKRDWSLARTWLYRQITGRPTRDV